MKKIVVPIRGMHCRSCELLIEENLLNISGVKSVELSYKRHRAEITAERDIDAEELKMAVEEAGYEIGEDDKRLWFAREWEVYENVSYGLMFFALLYVVATYFGVFEGLSVDAEGESAGLFFVLLIGLTAGVSTCMALVGGLVFSISARHAEMHPEATPREKFVPHLFFNLGRILGYFLLGGLMGMLGNVFEIFGTGLAILTLIVGLVMLVVGVQITGISPRIKSFSFSLPASVAKVFGVKKRHEKSYSHLNSMVAGALTFFLPCGFTQAMQIYAISTGSFIQGGLIMAVFALGTMPGLLGIGGLTSFVKGRFAKKFFAFIGVLVVFFAVLNIGNGLNLLGW